MTNMNQNTAPRMPIRVMLLISLYVVLTLIAIWRAITFQAFDLLTLGVIPMLIGIVQRAAWTKILLLSYVSLQTLGLAAMTTTAVIAYQITPDDVKLVFQGYNIPLIPLWLLLLSLVVFQWWVGLSNVTRDYLIKK
ncbi:hypothetical protein CXF80_16355 [Shewanella sp. Actino-trap-3]|jgi:hypothetical protein|uniref:Uncharacterized protein n=2 Tax=Shewanellaceae TaxID=267890 RepID=A0A3N4EHQ3_9GAMM|nr:hypothetical protein EGC80_07495 [Shewanella psychromarinicola]PKG79750.1 hypothetical protein CXF80_16355 [Shewanella sp. Actino-trap-3]RPA33431.1 hypothetical protein EGC77_08870 [Shewanella psychromarinicola]